MGSYKAAYDYLEGLMIMGLVADVGEEPPPILGNGLSAVLLRFGKSDSRRLVIPVLTPEELPPASSRD